MPDREDGCRPRRSRSRFAAPPQATSAGLPDRLPGRRRRHDRETNDGRGPPSAPLNREHWQRADLSPGGGPTAGVRWSARRCREPPAGQSDERFPGAADPAHGAWSGAWGRASPLGSLSVASIALPLAHRHDKAQRLRVIPHLVHQAEARGAELDLGAACGSCPASTPLAAGQLHCRRTCAGVVAPEPHRPAAAGQADALLDLVFAGGGGGGHASCCRAGCQLSAGIG